LSSIERGECFLRLERNNFDTNEGSAQELCKFGAITVKPPPVRRWFLAQQL